MQNLNINPLGAVQYSRNISSSQIGKYNNNLKELQSDTVEFCGNITKKSSGTFANKKFSVECEENMMSRKLSGNIDDLKFNIKHNGKIFKSDTITGNIGDKELNLKIKEGFISPRIIQGTIGEDPVTLQVTSTWSGYRIKGNFKGNEIDVKLKGKWQGYSLESDNMSLDIKNKNIFSSDLNIKGYYNDDPDLIPILLDSVYCLDDELIMAMS